MVSSMVVKRGDLSDGADMWFKFDLVIKYVNKCMSSLVELQIVARNGKGIDSKCTELMLGMEPMALIFQIFENKRKTCINMLN